LLNDEGPDFDSDDNGLWRSRGVEEDSPHHADLLDPPSQLTIEEVFEISKMLTVPSPDSNSTLVPPITTSLPLASGESNQRTMRTHDVFNLMEQQIVELSKELDDIAETDSLDAFAIIDAFSLVESKCIALHEALEKQKRKTPSLDTRRAKLITQLGALDSRIQVTRALLPPDNRPRKFVNGGYLHLSP